MDPFISAIANGQHGVVTRRQLLAAGVSRNVVEHRVKQQRLHVVHRGVYAVGHRRLTREGRWIAAVLAAGRGAVLSHRAAAALWGLRPYDGLEVTAPSYRTHPGITIHTSRPRADEVTSIRAVPVTGVSRTLLDLAAVLPAHQVERAVNEAEVLRLTDPLSLADLAARHPRRPGIQTIKTILAAGASLARSELEARFLRFVRAARLPRPAANAPVLGFECDCVWREQRVVVELDGRAAHGTAAAFERDRVRDRALHAAGWRVVRVTWRQLHDDAEALAADLRKMLAGERRRRARARAAGA